MGVALTNACALLDDGFHNRQTVLINGGRISAVAPDGELDLAGAECTDVGGRRLLPGFIDLQVNGGGGVMFNGDPTVDGIRRIGAAHRAFGTTGFLPTLISTDLDVVADAISAVSEAIDSGVPGVLGIHLEGPFLNVRRKGVHDASKFRSLDADAIALLASLMNGRTLVTLAPEMVAPADIAALVDAGIVVAAGHSDAGYDEVRAAIDAGLSGFTHLFNAMPPLTSREPGVVGAALDDPGSWCGLIVDGFHVHPATLRIAVAGKPRGRCLLVTDAMSGVGHEDRSFMLDGRRIEIVNGKCVTADGTLAGSNLDMAAAVGNAVEQLGVDVAEAARMASRYPAEALGLGHELGRIADGYRADLALADDQLKIVRTWIRGVPSSCD